MPTAIKKNLRELYVDHLTLHLERRPIAEILDFLARYVGWDTLSAYIKEKTMINHEHDFVYVKTIKTEPFDETGIKAIFTEVYQCTICGEKIEVKNIGYV